MTGGMMRWAETLVASALWLLVIFGAIACYGYFSRLRGAYQTLAVLTKYMIDCHWRPSEVAAVKHFVYACGLAEERLLADGRPWAISLLLWAGLLPTLERRLKHSQRARGCV